MSLLLSLHCHLLLPSVTVVAVPLAPSLRLRASLLSRCHLLPSVPGYKLLYCLVLSVPIGSFGWQCDRTCSAAPFFTTPVHCYRRDSKWQSTGARVYPSNCHKFWRCAAYGDNGSRTNLKTRTFVWKSYFIMSI